MEFFVFYYLRNMVSRLCQFNSKILEIKIVLTKVVSISFLKVEEVSEKI